ncbi:DEAD/DEAH box helicase [Vibrio sp. HA2012]|uniref:DEAD/DEAH box helicase n=1 Tax=Vibrio sp. HA2012 TaxID=1971595 RepID=UPI000C2C6569|nr:DEAD/DEAH box helicase [Vibrio sp. HA2012]PJC87446.1 DEAD/DEAH box helicase [Vibrio sp. HA2012]
MSSKSLHFSQLSLDHRLTDRVAALGFQSPTDIQIQAIPLILEGEDLLAGAQTGTGKTAAFGLPVIHALLNKEPAKNFPANGVRSLIVTPTRELAQQVFDNLVSYSDTLGLSIVAAYGGVSLNPQKEKLKNGADILVATPGRLLDHAYNKTVDLCAVETVVFDEADRMLDMGFLPDIQRIFKRLPQQRQTLLFSATFDKKVKTLAYRLLNSPKEIQIHAQNSAAELVSQILYPVDKKRKRELLAYLIGSRNWQQVLVFTKTREGSELLAKELKLDGIKAAAINGDKSQGARQKALDDFKSGKVRALIATDVAARGLDISELECVVNFDMPFKAEDYVHRIGRTGRAGKNGLAVSMMSRDEEYMLAAIEALIDMRVPQEWLAGFEPSPAPVVDEQPRSRRSSRSAEKRKMKAKLKIHQNRGKNSR